MNQSVKTWYDSHATSVIELSDDLWNNPETAMNEHYACEKVAEFMRAQGFDTKELNVVNPDGDGKPNCVIATYGQGKPVIGILGELDALAGLGQERVPYQSSKAGPGHGCGHNLMGAGCAGAAAALKQAMVDEALLGTLIYFGCPAEEALEGKVHMAKHGWFDNLDFCLAWHPGPTPLAIGEMSMQALTNLRFNFHGKTAHAAANPEHGRSALDAAELMNIGVQYLREHVPDGTRIHYVYTHAGEVPNIVPDYAQLHYFVRSKTRKDNDEALQRVIDIAEGAAKMTGTTTDYELRVGCYDGFVCHSINQFCHQSAQKIPAIEWTESDKAYANELYKNATGTEPTIPLLYTDLPPLTGKVMYVAGSSDVGDVSHIVPTCQLMGPGMVGGLPIHHWSVVSAVGTDIGHKAEIHAGKVVAQCGYDALKNPEAIDKIWADFREARRNMPPYKPVLPD